jgi:hypothetical protein
MPTRLVCSPYFEDKSRDIEKKFICVRITLSIDYILNYSNFVLAKDTIQQLHMYYDSFSIHPQSELCFRWYLKTSRTYYCVGL